MSRRGRRAAAATVVVHARPEAGDGPRAGFVVGRTVGGAVVRNRVRRRLRHLVAGRIEAWPGGTTVVVRALPAAAVASYATLESDLDACLRRVLPREAA
nr:ribonuclease P protein component [Nocardioides litoris]